MYQLIALILGITWLGMGLYEGKVNALFRTQGTSQFRLILKGAGYAIAGVIALYSSTLDADSATITLAIAALIFVATWFFMRQITNHQKQKTNN